VRGVSIVRPVLSRVAAAGVEQFADLGSAEEALAAAVLGSGASSQTGHGGRRNR